MVNIFAPTPNTNPSFLNSIAEDTMEFAKPVMGTSVPAPACFASLSNMPSPVKRAARNMSVTGTKIFTVSSGILSHRYTLYKYSANVHIRPPTTNAFMQSSRMGDFFAVLGNLLRNRSYKVKCFL